jgi:hypothetical protein
MRNIGPAMFQVVSAATAALMWCKGMVLLPYSPCTCQWHVPGFRVPGYQSTVCWLLPSNVSGQTRDGVNSRNVQQWYAL